MTTRNQNLNAPRSFSRDEDPPQLVTPCYIKPNSAGGEIITFQIHLMFFHLVCIVNVPAQGETKATAYVKFLAYDPKRDEYTEDRTNRVA